MPLRIRGKLPNLNKVARDFKKNMPKILGNIALNHYLDGFRKGGGQTDASRSGWRKRKIRDKRGKGRRAILVKTGQLRNDISVKKANPRFIVIGTKTTPYASYHNKGVKPQPQREFLGKSRALNRKLAARSSNEFKRATR